MPKVIADISMSLDGFVTGEGAHEQSTAQSRAVVMGRRLFDVVNGPISERRDGAPHLRTRADVDRDVEVRRRPTRAPEARNVYVLSRA
jgi:hypothetical protein